MPEDGTQLVVIPENRFHHNETLSKLLSPHKHRIQSEFFAGYIVAASFMDQQTSALGRLLSLQCWGASLGMSVVEPFMKDSLLQIPITLKNFDASQFLRFQDIFNIEHWHKTFVLPAAFSPLVSWNKFLLSAPREVILVAFSFSSGSTLCPDTLETFQMKCSSFLERYGFKVISKVCINTKKLGNTTEKEFKQKIFGDYHSNITVVLSEWRGIGRTGNGEVIVIPKTNCPHYQLRLKVINNSLLPNPKIYDNTKEYIDKYLQNEEYLALMFRFEWVGQHMEVIERCLSNTMKFLRLMQQKEKLNRTFVTTDVGRFGSNALPAVNAAISHKVELFMQVVHADPSLSLQEWEKTFVDVAETTNPGYIALLQKSIAVKAKCILLIGGGGFQSQALSWYKDLHPALDQQCYSKFDNCRITGI